MKGALYEDNQDRKGGEKRTQHKLGHSKDKGDKKPLKLSNGTLSNPSQVCGLKLTESFRMASLSESFHPLILVQGCLVTSLHNLLRHKRGILA